MRDRATLPRECLELRAPAPPPSLRVRALAAARQRAARRTRAGVALRVAWASAVALLLAAHLLLWVATPSGSPPPPGLSRPRTGDPLLDAVACRTAARSAPSLAPELARRQIEKGGLS